MRLPIIIASLLIAAPAISQSQSESLLLQRTINKAGERCDSIANLRAGGLVDDGDVLLIVDCSDGSSHVVRLAPDDSVSYFVNCAALANPVDC